MFPRLAGLFGLVLALLAAASATHAAELTFNRAYLGNLSGQTYTTTSLLNADPGSIRFSDGGTQRTFNNASGTLHYTIAGVPYAEPGLLRARYPNGNVIMDAVAFEGTGGFRLIVLGGSYAGSSSYGGSSNGIVERLNEYILATAPDPAQTTLQVDNGSSASVSVGGTASIVVTVKLNSGAAVEGAIASLSASPSNLSSTSPATATTNASGQATFTVQGLASGSVTYNAVASANGTTTTSSGSVVVTYVGVRDPALSTASVPNGSAGVPTSVVVTVRDSGGTVMTGLAGALAASVGGTNVGAAISAIADTGNGTYTFSYTPASPGVDTVAITLDGTQIDGSPYSSTVGGPALAITTVTLPTPVLGVAYSEPIATSGGTAPIGFAVSAGALPAGLSLDASTGVLSGSPTTPGAFSFTVTATDLHDVTASRAYSGVVGAGIAITTGTLPTPLVGVSYSESVVTTGGTAPVGFTISAGALPAGLSLDSSTGVISGAATAAGAYSFAVTATDTNDVSATETYSGVIGAGIAITTASLPTPVVGAPYSQAVASTGGTGPVNFTVSAGTLPAGLSIDATTGVITGTPTGPGAYSFTVTATDANSVSDSKAYSGVIGGGLAITTATLPIPVLGAAYDQQVATTGGAAPVGLTISAGALPPGLSLDPSTGAISGTPTTAGAYSFTVTATDSNGVSDSKAYSGAIAAAPPTASALALEVAYDSAGTSITLASSDPNSSFALEDAPAHGAVTLNGAVATYVPAAGYVGADRFSYVAAGHSGTSAPAEVTVTVLPPPPPIAESAPDQTLGSDSTSTTTIETATIDLTRLISGIVTSVQIVAEPQNGVVSLETRTSPAASARKSLSGAMQQQSLNPAAASASTYVAVYTPNRGFIGRDSFSFVAIGPGGVSAPAMVNIDVIPHAPTAALISATSIGGQPVVINLPGGGGPLTGGLLHTQSPESAGEARLIEGGVAGDRTYALEFRPDPAFEGVVTFTYTLTNTTGTSQPLTVMITVTARANPALDADVRGLSSAETETVRRFTRAQLDNFRGRLEAIRQGGGGGVSLTSGVSQRDEPLPGWAREAAPSTLSAPPAAAASESRARESSQDRSGLAQVWAGGAISVGRRDARTGEAKLDIASSGLSAGLDAPITDSLVVGVGVGAGHEVTQVGSMGSHLDADNWVAAAYASFRPAGGVFVDGVIGAGDLDFSIRRHVTPVGGHAYGDRDGALTFGSIAAGIARYSGDVRWSSYGRVEALRAQLDAYAEHGPDLYSLSYGKRTIDSVVGVIGATLELDRKMMGGLLTPRARLELQHEFMEADAQTVHYQDWLSGAGYAVDADGWARTRVTGELGAELQLRSGWALTFDLGGEFGEGHQLGTIRLGAGRQF